MDIQLEGNIIKVPDLEFDEECGGIGNIFFKVFRKFSERIALINTRNDEYYTYGNLLEKCISTAMQLKKRGFKEQDLIAICSNRENLDANVPLIAGQFLGCITFSIDPYLTFDECLELIEQVPPKIIFVIEESKELLTKVFQKLAVNCEIIVFGEEFEDEFLKMEDNNDTFKPFFIHNLDETCVIHFSSGTTGTPKPICLGHYYFLALLDTTGFESQNTPQQRIFADHPMGSVSLRFTNWYWVSASFELVICIWSGSCRLMTDKFNRDEFWELVEKYQVTEAVLTPLNCVELSQYDVPNNIDISSLYKITAGGYVLHKDYIHTLRKKIPGVHIFQVYGMTECGGVTTFDVNLREHLRLLLEKPQSCGLPTKGLRYKIVDVNTGEKCGPNRPGELYLKGKKLFNGFYKQDASKSFDSEGYFRTGDLVYFDEDFCFYILDRMKAVLGWRDWLIYPYHIEKVLLNHPAVLNCIVIGIPHRVEGERLMGVVILNDGYENVTADELVKYIDERVEDHKRLREGIQIVDYLPTTTTGKISRLKVKQMIMKLLPRNSI